MSLLRILISVGFAATLCSCAPPSYVRSPLPGEIADRAIVRGMPEDIRAWGDRDISPDQYEQMVHRLRNAGIADTEINWLVLSGGGQNGAFGAGLLTGWTESGTRPEFQSVTGVSTGALIAPLAFLGPEYDDLLEDRFTGLRTKDIMRKRGVLRTLMSDAAMNADGLRSLIESTFDQEVVDALAHEWERGRTLTVGTTNLDAMRPVRWDLTRIAASGHPDRLELIRQILLASASIPAVFPPVIIKVEADGRRYDEMHVDGGITSQLYAYPLAVDMREFLDDVGVTGSPNLYVIRNGFLYPDWTTVNPKLINIASQSITSLIRTQGIGDVYQIFIASVRDDLNFYLTSIPEDFDRAPEETFDPEYIRAIFDLGYEMARNGYPWDRYPPNFDPKMFGVED